MIRLFTFIIKSYQLIEDEEKEEEETPKAIRIAITYIEAFGFGNQTST